MNFEIIKKPISILIDVVLDSFPNTEKTPASVLEWYETFGDNDLALWVDHDLSLGGFIRLNREVCFDIDEIISISVCFQKPGKGVGNVSLEVIKEKYHILIMSLNQYSKTEIAWLEDMLPLIEKVFNSQISTINYGYDA